MRVLIVAVIVAFGFGAGAEEDAKGKWEKCPVPACMAPCAEDAAKDVKCKAGDGKTSETSWACCCCGGGAGSNTFKRVKPKK
jgi:hypothetical protein